MSMNREKFEAWAEQEKLSLTYGDCGYVFSPTAAAWKAWQAASKASEQQLAAVVAENAGLKQAAEFATAPDMWEELGGDVLRYQYKDWYVDKLKAAMKIPATDAYLAEVRAQGVEMFASHLRTNDSEASVCKMIALGADEFAAQLRQGAKS